MSPSPSSPPAAPAAVPLSRSAAGAARVWQSDVLAALSHALDLTEGQPIGHTVRSCMIGMRLADELGFDDEARAALYYALLLKDAGCSSNAARMSALFGADDRVVKPRMKLADRNHRVRLAWETFRCAGLGSSMALRIRHFLGIARTPDVTRDLISVRCDRGAAIARQLGFPDATADTIRSLDEHWNGGGYPDALRGDAIPLGARIANLAQTLEVFLTSHDAETALRVVRERRGTWFDPALVKRVHGWRRDDAWWRAVAAASVETAPEVLAPAPGDRALDDAGLDTVAHAFAEIIDAKSPYTYRHSEGVARFAVLIGEEMGVPDEEHQPLLRAGLLHDIGKLGISNRILDKQGPLDAEERAVMARHPVYTWEVLSRVRAFAGFAWAAALHHEKLDGSGYPWGMAGPQIDTHARILAVADIYEALTANRPYRAGMAPAAALGIIARERGDRLCGEAVDALASLVARGAAEPMRD